MSDHFIPTGEPQLDGNEKKYIRNCFSRNWISQGKQVETFEKKVASYVGVRCAVAVSSGTAALHLALLACGIGPGDEVIIPDFSIIVSASQPILVGARPVLVDVDKSWCIDPKKIEEKITKRTKAIMPVHMYGTPANLIEIKKIAKKHKVTIIEDACAAIGSKVGGRPVGSIGDIGCFSFYATKTITTGEGGMLVTNNHGIANLARLLRNQAFESIRYIHHRLGFSYRMTDFQAALGNAQMEQIAKKIARKKEIAKIYDRLLKNSSDIELPKKVAWGETVPWMYGILVNKTFGRERDEIIILLKKRGIQAQRFFEPIHLQPVFEKQIDKRYPDIRGRYPVATDLGKRGLYLPTGLSITEKQQRYIIKTLFSLKI